MTSIPSPLRQPRSGILILLATLALGPLQQPAQAQVGLATDSVLLAALRRGSPTLITNRVAVEAANARLRATGFAPPLTLRAEAEEIPSGVNLPGATLRFGLEREFLPRGWSDASRALAETEVRIATAAAELAEQRLLAEGTRALLQIAGGERIDRRLAAEDSLLAGAETALQARFSVGEARYVDVLRLRTERLRIQSERAEAITQSALGRRALEALLGPTGVQEVGVDALASRVALAMFDSAAAALPPPPDTETLLARSGALRVAAAGVERAQAARSLTQAGQRPRISGGLGLQTFEYEGGNTFGPSLEFSMSLPTTARGANRAALAAAEAEIRVSEAEQRATEATLRGALLAARDRYEAARARLALFDTALMRGARMEREAALAAYGSGELSLVELIDFERALSRAEIERVQARVDAADALAELFSAAAGAVGDEPSTFRVFESHER